jgi:signal transduction histidine kinase
MGEAEITKGATRADRSVQPVKLGSQLVLGVGFGGLLAMMALAGIDSIAVLIQIQNRNHEIRQNFLTRNRALEQIRAQVYLSATVARDYLLDRDPARSEAHRAVLQNAKRELDTALQAYSRSFVPGQTDWSRTLEGEIRSYWNALETIFHWDAKEKQIRSDEFVRNELVPRRAIMLGIADKIGAANEQELARGDEQLAIIFNGFRARLIAVLAITLTLGIILSAVVTRRLVRIAHNAETRFNEIMRAQQELKNLSARLVEMQERERRTISRELHDEVGQSLSAVLMEIGNLGAILPAGNPELRSHLESIKNLAENSVKVVRNMTLLLRPSMLDDLGLVPALQWQARETFKRTGMEVEVVAENVEDDLPETHKTCIYRVMQEALHNCVQHAGARSVKVVVSQGLDRILLTVQDNGKGFDAKRGRGMGLLGMEERVTHLDGAFQVQSTPGQGTTLTVELPLALRVVEPVAVENTTA